MTAHSSALLVRNQYLGSMGVPISANILKIRDVTGEWHEPFRALPLLFRCTDARADSGTHMPCHPCRLQGLRQRHYQGSTITSDLPFYLTLSVGSDKLIEFGALVDNKPTIQVIVITGDQKKTITSGKGIFNKIISVTLILGYVHALSLLYILYTH